MASEREGTTPVGSEREVTNLVGSQREGKNRERAACETEVGVRVTDFSKEKSYFLTMPRYS